MELGASNPQSVKNSTSTTGGITSYSVTATVAINHPANSNRISIDIWNETGTLYVALGTAASDTNYSYRLTANTSLPNPIVGYTGIVSFIKASGTTAVRVSEIG